VIIFTVISAQAHAAASCKTSQVAEARFTSQDHEFTE
jgi:hypothetical protein